MVSVMTLIMVVGVSDFTNGICVHSVDELHKVLADFFLPGYRNSCARFM